MGMLLVLGATESYAQTRSIGELIALVNAAPSVYGTPEATSYFAAKPNNGSMSFSTDRDAAMSGLRAAIDLGTMEAEASGAVASLVAKFPRIVHVSVIRAAHFAPGMGGFDDWVQTYVLNETNKVLLTSVLLEYTTMQKCEDFITSSQEVKLTEKRMNASGKILEATADIYIIITVNGGACALTKITGQTLGDNRDAWQGWWNENGSAYTAAEPSVLKSDVKPALDGISIDLSSLFVGGKYRLVLKTGDVFTGTVESVADNGIIFETEDKKPYTFARNLISQQQLLDVPEKFKAIPSSGEGVSETEILTFDNLAQNVPSGLRIEVSMTSGIFLRGTLEGISNGVLTLSIDGSKIPISKDAISALAKALPPKAHAAPKPVLHGPYDTLIVSNPRSDEYGKPLEDILIIGDITGDDGKSVLIKLMDASVKAVPYSQIVRRIVHDENAGFSEIERYGKPLFCSPGMKLVDVPLSKPGKPFFKVCIDTYEWPNQKGVAPLAGISYDDAKKNCESIGKRLCTSDEWLAACGGLENLEYPYGRVFTQESCNGNSRAIEVSGNRVKCAGKLGAYDMTGNVFEWVDAPLGSSLMGGPLSKCQTVSPGTGGGAKPSSGGRCCKSN